MFTYCGNNPVNFTDLTGEFLGGGAAAIGGSLLSLVLIGLTLLSIADDLSSALAQSPSIPDLPTITFPGTQSPSSPSVNTYPSTKNDSKSTTKSKAKEKDAVTSSNNSVYIYRYGGTNPGNLTPSEKDVRFYKINGKGLSFSLESKPGSGVTTIEAINATGLVYAVKDGPNHVSVYPIGGTLEDWHNAGSSSVWTKAVKSVVIKWDGGD